MAKEIEDYEEEISEEEEQENIKVNNKSKKKEDKPTVQKTCSDNFTAAIKEYLDGFAERDNHFKECYANPKKSIVECCAYIVGQVQKMNVYGLDNNEVYQLARHYYLEEINAKDLQVTYQPNRVISNKHIDVTITAEEKAKAKEDAIKEYQRKCEEELKIEKEKDLEALKKQKEKEEERLKKQEEKKKEKQDILNTQGEQLSLFNL